MYLVYSRCVDRAKNEHPILEKLIVYLARDCTGMSMYMLKVKLCMIAVHEKG